MAKAKTTDEDVSTFMQKAKSFGPASLRDHLVNAGFVTSPSIFRSMRTKVQLAIQEGGPYANMRGTLIYPSIENVTEGRFPKWAGDAAPLQDRLPAPNFKAKKEYVAPVLEKNIPIPPKGASAGRKVGPAGALARGAIGDSVFFPNKTTGEVAGGLYSYGRSWYTLRKVEGGSRAWKIAEPAKKA